MLSLCPLRLNEWSHISVSHVKFEWSHFSEERNSIVTSLWIMKNFTYLDTNLVDQIVVVDYFQKPFWKLLPMCVLEKLYSISSFVTKVFNFI